MLVSWLHFRRLLIGRGAMGFLECMLEVHFSGRDSSFGLATPVFSNLLYWRELLPLGVNVCSYLELTIK